MIRGNPMHDTEHPPGQVRTIGDYVAKVQEEESLTKAPQVCYTITTGMSLRDFKDGMGQAYWNRDRETLDRLLESLQPAS